MKIFFTNRTGLSGIIFWKSKFLGDFFSGLTNLNSVPIQKKRLAQFKWIVLRDWGGLLLIPVDRCNVLGDIPLHIFFQKISMSSLQLKLKIGMPGRYRFYVAPLLGVG
jgi:hypothetical protein